MTGPRNEPNLDRRTVLKMTGSATSASALGLLASSPATAVPDVADPGERVGARRFVETKLTHTCGPSYRVGTGDGLPSYVYDQAEGRVLVTRADRLPTFRGNGLLVRGTDFRGRGEPLYDDAPEGQVTMDTDYRRVETYHLDVEDAYDYPDVRVHPKGREDIEVVVDGESTIVAAGEERSVLLDEREVEVRQRSQEVTEVEVPDYAPPERFEQGDTKEVNTRGSVETQTVQPKLTVRNAGRVDVFDATEVGL